MEDTSNGVRIRTNVASDKVLNVNLTRNIDFLEVLSLKLNTRHEYKLMTSKTGVIIGRVLANGGFGIPNAKVSIFVPVTDEDYQDTTLRSIYPYKTPTSKNADGIRYNLLPDSSSDACYQVIGNFPNKRLVLDDGLILEAYEKYYKLTTVTNASGDYMLYGVPTGSQKLHVDIDLSDIGVLSQRPIDLIYKGANINQFESPKLFKKDTNLDGLTQVYSQNEAVDVYPFWGDENSGVIAVTRCDINIDYKFEPTCVFMGATFTDSGKNSFSHRCKPSADLGKNSQLIAREGNIEMIRKTREGNVESFAIQGTELINGDGVFCYQIPMNLDYVTTDEYGNTVASDDINRGIPTRTSVRFRFTLSGADDDGGSVFRAKYLVPNNPDIIAGQINASTKKAEPTAAGTGGLTMLREENGRTWDSYYKFGSETRDEDFKDLYWNQVYSVKNYIPRLQKGLFATSSKKYSGIKAVNYSGQNNPAPYNRIRIKLNFSYVLLCIIGKIIINAVGFINLILSIYDQFVMSLAKWFYDIYRSIYDIKILGWHIFSGLAKLFWRVSRAMGGKYVPDFGSTGYDRNAGSGWLYDKGCISIDFFEDSERLSNRYIIPRCVGYNVVFVPYGANKTETTACVTCRENSLVQWAIDKQKQTIYGTWDFGGDIGKVTQDWTMYAIYAGSEDPEHRVTGTTAEMRAKLLSNDGKVIKTVRLEYKNDDTIELKWGENEKVARNTMYEEFEMGECAASCYESGQLSHEVPPLYNSLNQDLDSGQNENDLNVYYLLEHSGTYDYRQLAKTDIKDTSKQYKINDETWSEKSTKLLNYETLYNELERMLADEYEIVSLDFYNDWLNGGLYFPLWYRKKTRKKNVFGIFTIASKERYCQCLGPNREGNGVDPERRGNNSRNWRYYTRLGSYGELPLNNTGEPNGSKLNSWNGTTQLQGDGEKSRFLKRSRLAMRFKNGIILNTKNWDGLNLYYYSNGAFTLNKWKNDGAGRELGTYIPLFGTDIISLGSLNECDINGVPQFFRRLTSTTANVPPVGSEYQEIEGTSTSSNIGEDFETDATLTITDTIEINGMDYNDKGATSAATWHNGLFMNLKCLTFFTIPKTVINAERLSEFGMYIDGLLNDAEDDTEQDSSTTDSEERSKYADGLVATFEIFDPDGRSMFATLNGGNLNKKVQNPLTGYYIHEMDYTYLYGFNGMLKKTNTTTFLKSTMSYHDIDNEDTEYVNFRYGKNINKRFVCHDNVAYFTPYYNNSLYFYLGLLEGKSALDVFNKQFYGACPETTLEVTSRQFGTSTYAKVSSSTWEQYKPSVNDSIVVNGLDINTQLFQGDQISIENVVDNSLVMQGTAIKAAANIAVTDSFSSPIVTNELGTAPDSITPGTYRVSVRKANGRVMEDTVTIPESTTYDFSIATDDLMSSYISEDVTPESQFTTNKTYGKINLSSVSVNGVQYAVNNAVSNRVKLENQDKLVLSKNEVIIFLENGLIYLLKVDNGSDDYSFICETARNSGAYLNFENGVATLYAYKPTSVRARLYKVKSVDVNLSYVMECEEEPAATAMAVVGNGQTYQAFLNNVPVPFIADYAITSHNNIPMDRVNVHSAETRSATTYSLIDNAVYGIWGEQPIEASDDIERWLHVEDPANDRFYKFPKAYSANSVHQYSDFIKFDEQTLTVGELKDDARLQVMAYRLRCALNMAAGSYYTGGKLAAKLLVVTREEGETVSYNTVSPYYNGFTNWYYTNEKHGTEDTKDPKDKYNRKFNIMNYASRSEIRLNNHQPTIVGPNFCYKEDRDQMMHVWPDSATTLSFAGWKINPIYGEYIQNPSAETMAGDAVTVGNYFAGSVSNNGKLKVSYPSKFASYQLGSRELSAPLEESLYNMQTTGKFKQITTTGGTTGYTVTSVAVESNPMIRTQFVDKRLDYDLDVNVPARNSGEHVTVSGTVYNGVSMVYTNPSYPTITCYDVQAGDVNKSGSDATGTTYTMYEAEGDKFLYAAYIPANTKSIKVGRSKAFDIEKGTNVFTVTSVNGSTVTNGRWSTVEPTYAYYDEYRKMIYLDANGKLGIERGREIVGSGLEYEVGPYTDINTGRTPSAITYQNAVIYQNRAASGNARFYKAIVQSDGNNYDFTDQLMGKEFTKTLAPVIVPSEFTNSNRHTIIVKGCSYNTAAYVDDHQVKAIAKYEDGINIPIPTDGWFKFNEFVLGVNGVNNADGSRRFLYNTIKKLSFQLSSNYLNSGYWNEYFQLPDPEITVDGRHADVDALFKVVHAEKGAMRLFNGTIVTGETALNRGYYDLTAEECKSYTCGFFKMTTADTVSVDENGNAEYYEIGIPGQTCTLQFINRRLFLNKVNNGLNEKFRLNLSSDIYRLGIVVITANIADSKPDELYYDIELTFRVPASNNLFDRMKPDDVTMTIYQDGESQAETIYIHERQRVTSKQENGFTVYKMRYGVTMYNPLTSDATYLIKLVHKSQYGPETTFDDIILTGNE